MGTGSFREGNRSGKEEFGSRRAGGRDRPRTNPGGFLGEADERDPTRDTGIGLLDAADVFLQQRQTPQDITPPTERDRRAPNDERPSGGLLRPRPKPPEDEAPLIPGDPSNLGGRGRRRRPEDDDRSPVLRRGLLGV